MVPTPGHDCPGLIEARTSDSPAGWRRPSTPGHDCPGLIEARSTRRRAPRLPAPLRGMIAPASLKHGILRDFLCRRQPTPGHDCPGLIEAGVNVMNNNTNNNAHSGA